MTAPADDAGRAVLSDAEKLTMLRFLDQFGAGRSTYGEVYAAIERVIADRLAERDAAMTAPADDAGRVVLSAAERIPYPGDLAIVEGRRAMYIGRTPGRGRWQWQNGDWTSIVIGTVKYLPDLAAETARADAAEAALAELRERFPQVEVDKRLDAPTTCRVSVRGVLVFDGVSRDAVAAGILLGEREQEEDLGDGDLGTHLGERVSTRTIVMHTNE